MGKGGGGEEELAPGMPQCRDDPLAQKPSINDLRHNQVDSALPPWLEREKGREKGVVLGQTSHILCLGWRKTLNNIPLW